MKESKKSHVAFVPEKYCHSRGDDEENEIKRESFQNTFTTAEQVLLFIHQWWRIWWRMLLKIVDIMFKCCMKHKGCFVNTENCVTMHKRCIGNIYCMRHKGCFVSTENWGYVMHKGCICNNKTCKDKKTKLWNDTRDALTTM